ncbi:hypothetical protein H0H93_007033 [Arthromyces matolae]|nr:hypothetical protein H0H93_007033 [Arthromyces matolae]
MAPPPGLSTESTYVPKAFLPPNTNPPLMVPKKEYPEALNSLFNIVGLVGTAVTKDLEKKTWDRWVKNFKDRYDFGGMKFPNGGSSHPILAGTKLVERKQMIRDVVRDHNQGKWYKPDNHIEDEIRKVHELGEWDAVKKENTILMAARNAVAPVRQQTFPSPPNDTSIQGVPAMLPPHPITDIPARPKSPIKSIGAEEMYHFSGIHPGAAPSPDPKGYCHTANAEIIQTASHNAASLQQESPPGPKSSYTMQGSTAMSPCYPTPIVNDNKRASLPVTSVVPRPHTGTDARQSAGIPASHGGSALHQNDANNHWPGSMPQTPPVTFTDSHIDPFTGISLLHSGSSWEP